MTRTAVIGMGAMGKHHARIYRELGSLVAVADPVADVALDVKRYHDYAEMLYHEKVHAVSICTPTTAHAEIALDLIWRGIHVLIEKPIAATVADGTRIVKAAKDKGVVCAVGHVERYNPAVVELRRRLADAGELYQVTTQRCGPFPHRINDAGVVIDLATHDIDIMRHIVGCDVAKVQRLTAQRLHQSKEDQAVGLFEFENGVLGLVQVNWLTPVKIRHLAVLGERGMFHVDYLTQDLYWFEHDANGAGWSTLDVMQGAGRHKMTRYPVPHVEPLRAELEAFLWAIDGDDRDIVTAREGVDALALAEAMCA
jgi:UDP-N-acetylglucosamine 3-dehydrogenase